MTKAIGAREAERADADEDQDAQDLLGRVRDRGQRVGRQHRQPGEPRQSFVMREVRGNRLADDQPLDLRENAFFGHGPSNGRRG